MYKHIGVPIDLAHPDTLEKALATAADLGKWYSAKITLISVSTTAPSAIAHNPEEFAEKLKAFAQDQAAKRDIAFHTRALSSTDLQIDLNKQLDKAMHDETVDLVIMGSHAPGFADYVFHGHSSYIATHSDLSVLVVR